MTAELVCQCAFYNSSLTEWQVSDVKVFPNHVLQYLVQIKRFVWSVCSDWIVFLEEKKLHCSSTLCKCSIHSNVVYILPFSLKVEHIALKCYNYEKVKIYQCQYLIIFGHRHFLTM